MHTFTPVAIETSGVFGPQSMVFLRDLGRRLTQVTGKVRSTTYLIQRLSVAVQPGNSTSVLGTTGQASTEFRDYILYYVCILLLLYLFFYFLLFFYPLCNSLPVRCLIEAETGNKYCIILAPCTRVYWLYAVSFNLST